MLLVMPMTVLLAIAALTQSPLDQRPVDLPLYLDVHRGAKERAADLVSHLTLAEKVSQMQNSAPAIQRLEIPAYDWWSEALHGPIGSPVTVFPQAIGLSSTFDLPLMHQVATAISDEGRARYYNAISKNRHGMHEGLTFWAPNINIFRDPRWGRGQETYGEDPFLTSQMAFQFVSGMQDEHDGHLKTVSTPKHFAVHSGPDPERHAFNAVVDPRDMWNTYLPAFRTAVQKAGAWSVMSAYSGVNGTPDSANSLLLQTILRDTWGFRGYVVSDCDAISDLWAGHHAFAGPMQAAAAAVKAGCDLDCGGTYGSLVEAVAKGYIDEPTIDRSVSRLFEARIRLGMFDPPEADPYRRLTMADVDSAQHKELALKAARECVVLLKNDGVLPIKAPKTLAVIGPSADDRSIPLGNYNGYPSKLVTILDGIRDCAPAGTRVVYAKGSRLLDASAGDVVPANLLVGGVHAEYFANANLEGPSVYTSDTPTLDFEWDQTSPSPAVPATYFSARFTTVLRVPTTGEYLLGTRSDDGSRLWIDDKQIVEDWTEHPPRDKTAIVHLEAGRLYKIRYDYYQAAGGAVAKLLYERPKGDDFSEAVATAKSSDVVVMALGISGALENEELDRTNIQIPAVQQRLLAAVEKAGKPVIVVLQSGSCIALDDPHVRGLVEAWYPGEQGGQAVAEVLFGKTNPSGRLPVTFYRSLDQVPPFRDYKMDRRTYRYLHPDQQPLYPFGFGLSYSRFAYSKPRLMGPKWGVPTSVEVTVRNAGPLDGDEVVQIYAQRDGAAWPEPLRRLVGFTRVHLLAGTAQTVSVTIPDGALATSDSKGNLSVIPGQYTLSIGGGQPGQEPSSSGHCLILTAQLPRKPKDDPDTSHR